MDGVRTDVLRDSINTWNTNVHHPLVAHSDPVPNDNAVFAATVLRG
jgi:hypothetical protein